MSLMTAEARLAHLIDSNMGVAKKKTSPAQTVECGRPVYLLLPAEAVLLSFKR